MSENKNDKQDMRLCEIIVMKHKECGHYLVFDKIKYETNGPGAAILGGIDPVNDKIAFTENCDDNAKMLVQIIAAQIYEIEAAFEKKFDAKGPVN